MTPVIQGATTTELLKETWQETWYQNHSEWESELEPESVNSLRFPTPLFSSTYDICCIKTHVHVCLCCVSVYSWGSFHWWRLSGLEHGQCTEDNFYAGIGFRTDQQNGLMFYHQGQVQITVWHIKSYFVYVNFMSNCVCFCPLRVTGVRWY